MKSLSTPNDPVISKRINYQMLGGAAVGFVLALTLFLGSCFIASKAVQAHREAEIKAWLHMMESKPELK